MILIENNTLCSCSFTLLLGF